MAETDHHAPVATVYYVLQQEQLVDATFPQARLSLVADVPVDVSLLPLRKRLN